MPKLTDAQLIILSAASQRKEGLVLPLPKTIKFNKAAATTVLRSLLKYKLIAERPAVRTEETWRAEKNQRLTLITTDAGLAAITAVPHPKPATPVGKLKAAEKKVKRGPSAAPTANKLRADAPPIGVRPGSKVALLKELLSRKSGVTVAEAVKATGWQAHSIRGAISGSIKKKLGFAVSSEKLDGRGRVYRLGRG